MRKSLSLAMRFLLCKMENRLYPIEVVQRIAFFLDMDDTLTLANICKLFSNILCIQREIIKQTKSQYIYNNEALLNIVYANHQNYEVRYCDISIGTYPELYEMVDPTVDDFGSIYDYSFVLKRLPTDKIVHFSNWFELVDVIFSIGVDLNRPW